MKDKWIETQLHRKEKGEQGFTLVELLVVMAIMAIMVGGIAVGAGILTSGDSKKASRTVLSTLEEVRTDTLSKKGEWKARIANTDGIITVDILKDEVSQSSTKLGSRIKLFYDFDSARTQLTDGNAILISYAPSSGKFLAITNQDGISIGGTQDNNYGYLYIEGNGSSSEYMLKLWYETGKITTEE